MHLIQLLGQFVNYKYVQIVKYKVKLPKRIFDSMKYLEKLKSKSLKVSIVLFFWCYLATAFCQLMVPDKKELFRDDIVSRVDIIIDQESLEFIIAPENRESNELFEATFIFSNENIRDTLESVGFRLRGNTSRGADKKSFKVNLNAFVPGRKYYGVQKINLNGQHNDPTSARAKICSDLADLLEIPSMRTNHVQLFINDEYYGLYSNVEHIDQNYVKKRFGNKNGNLYKCVYPADLNYKGNNPDAYKEIIFGRRNYDLKNNNQADDYTDFANLVKVLNLTSDANLACELENVFNVDQYLKTIVFDIIVGNWDGPIYNKNNFYLYHNEDTGLFEYLPYDLDNTLGIDWLNKDWGNRDIYTWSQDGETRPIYNRLMENQEYRDRFSFYMQETLLNIYNEAELYPYLDSIRSQLKEYLVNDIYYTFDYGFDISDFENGFEYELGYFQTDYGIKSFIQTRLIAAFTQLEINDIKPIITNLKYNHPNESEDLNVQVKVIDDQGIDKVFLTMSDTGISVAMRDDGEHFDGMANDGIYGITLPSILQVEKFEFYIEAKDLNGQESTYPRCSNVVVNVEEVDLKLAINEFMASNNTIIEDEKGDFQDWIELYNYGTKPIYLGDKYLSDNPNNRDKWSMPNYTLQPNEYLLFWADDDRNTGTFHTNFKLSKSGEHIGIYDNDDTNNEPIDLIDYDAQVSDISFGRFPNGTGDFTSLMPTPGNSNITTNTKDENKTQLLIYPNPTSDKVDISAGFIIRNVKLYNGIGKLLNTYMNADNPINLPNKAGIYYLQIVTESETSILKKVIKI